MVRQARANVAAHLLQAVLVLVTLSAAAGLLTIGLTGSAAAGNAYDALHERTNGAHLWVSFDPALVTPAEVERAVSTVPGVDASTGAVVAAEVTLPGADLSVFGGLAARAWANEQAVARPQIVEGRSPLPGELDVVLLDRNAAEHFDVDVGQELIVHTGAGRSALRVIGLSVSAESCPFPMCTPAFAYLAPEAFDERFAAMPVGQRALAVGLRLIDPSATDEALRSLDATLPAGAIRNATDHGETSEAVALTFSFQAAFLTAFGVVAAIVAVFLITVAVGGAVQAETRRIGLLKAVGFTGRQLRGVYLLEYLGLAVGAVAVGTAVAVLLAPPLLRPVAEQFGGASTPGLLRPVVMAALATLLLVVVAVLVPVRHAARLDAVAALRFGHAPPRRSSSRLLRLPLTLAHAVAELRASRRRAVLTTLALTVSTASLTFGIISLGNADQFARDPEFGMYAGADIFAIQSGYLTSPVVESHPAVTAVVRDYRAFFNFPNETERRQIRVRAGDVDTFSLPLIEGAPPRGANEAVIGFGLSQAKDLGVGDVTTIVTGENAREIRVVGIVRDFNNLGQMITVTEAFFPQLDRAQPNVPTLVKLRPGADMKAIAQQLEEAAEGLLHAEPVSARILPGQLNGIQGVTRSMVAVLIILTVVGVLNSLLLAVQERRREIGLLKSIGMTRTQVAASVTIGALVLAAIALAIGVPLGAIGTRVAIDASMRSIGFGPVQPALEAFPLLLVIPLVVIIVGGASWLPAQRASALPVIQTLRYE